MTAMGTQLVGLTERLSDLAQHPERLQNRALDRLDLRRFDARGLGALIGLFERAVGLYGELVNVNAYHQPGVEAGKLAAAGILSLQSRVEGLLADGQPRSLATIQTELELETVEPVFWMLRHLCANGRGYGADGDWGRPDSLSFHHTR